MTEPLANFLSKFCKEWQAGTDARLYVECHAGQAWVSLHQPLGHLPPPPPSSSRRPPGPSRLRRSAKRAQARAAASATPVPTATAEIAVQTDDAETFAAVAKAVVIPATVPQPPQAPADKAGHQAEQVLLTHHVPDALCPDGVYQSPAVQVVPPCHDVTQPAIPQLDGHNDDPVWSCKCCYYETFFDTEADLKQHHDHVHGDFLTYEECCICYPWCMWT